MLSKEEIESHIDLVKLPQYKANSTEKALVEYIEQLESDKQKLIEKLEERMKSVEKCYQDLIKPYYDEKINMINVSFMSRKEKEEFTNKRNCLLVQKHCYAEILEIVKGVENEILYRK